MPINPPQTPKEFFEFLVNEKGSLAKLRNEMNKDLGEKRIEGFRDRRQFLQNIVIASVTLLGLISVFATIGGSDIIRTPLFITGIGFHLLLVCFATIYIRESIDQDNEGLLKMQDRYGEISESTISLADEYLKNFYNDKRNVNERWDSYWSELGNLEPVRNLKAENKKLDDERRERLKGTTLMEFNGEIIVFLFVGGIFLILLSLTKYYLSTWYILLAFFLLFYVVFTDFLSKISKPFFRFLTFLTRVDIFHKK